jgi:hypothetical protein
MITKLKKMRKSDQSEDFAGRNLILHYRTYLHTKI